MNYILSLLVSMSILFNSPRNNSEFDMKKVGSFHYITLDVNGMPANLLVDTGCHVSYFDITTAKEFNINYRKVNSIKLIGIGGRSSDVYSLWNIDVTYNDIKIPVKLRGTDLKDLRKVFRKHGIKLDGIIGSDFFENYDVLIDYRAKKIIIR